MKVNKFLLLCFLFCLWVSTLLYSQASYGKNLNFELGNFTNWTGYTWRFSNEVPSINTNPVRGFVDRRHTIMSDTTEYDVNTGYALKKIPSGYLYSARLGDAITSSDRAPRCWEQSLRYTMTIDSSNALLILKFALVLQYIAYHAQTDEPRFRLTLYDSRGNILPDCSNYDVYATNKYVKGFKTYTPSGSTIPVVWRDWTTVGVNLLAYIGQTVTIEFMSADCAEQYHYGYAYFVAECHPLYISVKYCASDTAASLTAPEGFEKYSWKNSSGIVLDTLQTLNVNVPTQRSSYSCVMTSATGCVVSLNTSIIKYIPKADFSSFMIDCKSNTVQFTNLSTTTAGSLSYDWSFGDGNTSSQKSPPYTFGTSGMHTVTLILNNPPSSCADTLTKDIESFSPPLVGISGDSTYCPGYSTFISAYGASEYVWNNGSKSDSLEIGAPGGTFWVLGRSSTGCISDTVYKNIIEEPDWEFLAHGDTVICGNGNVILSASGAGSCYWNSTITLSEPGEGIYLWKKEITGDSIVVSAPGTYIVTGANARGCEKSLIFKVAGYPLPAAGFSVSPDAIDSKHSSINCIISAEKNVQYLWKMGDGSSETGSSVQHEFNIPDTVLYYMITLTATDEHDCTDSSFKFIDVVPFVPNVFSPDGDGINDIFMSGFELEIADRNGMHIYKGNSGWDGMYGGQPADPDTYFYLIYYSDSKEEIHTRKGFVTLVR